jgi:hypothetical protein
MARLNAPRIAGSNPSSRTDASPRNPNILKPNLKSSGSAWPFAAGSQNHLDETAAPWPRPASRPNGRPANPAK